MHQQPFRRLTPAHCLCSAATALASGRLRQRHQCLRKRTAHCRSWISSTPPSTPSSTASPAASTPTNPPARPPQQQTRPRPSPLDSPTLSQQQPQPTRHVQSTQSRSACLWMELTRGLQGRCTSAGGWRTPQPTLAATQPFLRHRRLPQVQPAARAMGLSTQLALRRVPEWIAHACGMLPD